MSSSPVTGEPWTIGRVLAWVSEDFAGRGIESPRLEAELLLSSVLGCNRIQLIIDRDRPLMSGELAAYRAMVARRRGREPVAYLRGEREFYGHLFRVDPRVLIPRPDTETLVEVALERTRDRSMYGRLLDVCTGSGNVALAFGKQRPTWKIVATDISSDALAVAAHNAVQLGLAWSAIFAEGDLFEPVRNLPPFDLITANPPYIPTKDIESLDADIRDHEPRIALDGGSDGLDLIRRLIDEGSSHLVEGGVLALEIQADQGPTVFDWMVRAGWKSVQLKQDLGERDRVVSGLRA